MIPVEIVVTLVIGWLVFHVIRWAIRAHTLRDENVALHTENEELKASLVLLGEQLMTATRPAQSAKRNP